MSNRNTFMPYNITSDYHFRRVLMGVPNSQLTNIFSAKCQLTTIFWANYQLTTLFWTKYQLTKHRRKRE